MNNPTVKIAGQSAATGELMSAAVLAASDIRTAQPSTQQIPLMVRTRKVVRLAPPIDNGFRPFRVF